MDDFDMVGRIPGQPDEKRQLLAQIDERSFPFLIADILYYLFGHKDVSVVDGPGDGKRDIHSISPAGNRHVTQCKFHHDTSTTVSSRETDELPVGLAKFGAKCGLFATTGKLSPQAKREYLDNYPEYELRYFEGVDIVDAVFSSPTLSAAWSKDGLINVARYKLGIPIIIRDAENDRPIEMKITGGEIEHFNVSFEWSNSSADTFAPYRSPNQPSFGESGGSYIRSLYAHVEGDIYIHGVQYVIKTCLEYLSEKLRAKSGTLILRIGTPCIFPFDTELGMERVPITKYSTQSFVRDKTDRLLEEREWVLFSGREDWKFPLRLSVLEADWAGWYNPALDTMLMEQLQFPTVQPPNYLEHAIEEAQREWLDLSLFLLGSIPDCKAFESALNEGDKPNFICQWGIGGKMIGWLHPNLDNNVMLVADPGSQNYTWKRTTQSNEFQQRVRVLRDRIINSGLNEITANRAKLIAEASGRLLSETDRIEEFRSARLVYYFDELPSPVYLRDRKLIFVRMWRVDADLDDVRESAKKISSEFILPIGVNALWDARLGHNTKEVFVLSSLTFDCPFDVSADAFFDSIIQCRNKLFDECEKEIMAECPNAILATKEFWKSEVGMLFDYE